MKDANSEVLRRLQSADGHLHAIIGMIADNQTCEEILHQLDAVQAALRALSFVILEEQLQQSSEIIKNSDCPEDRSDEIVRMDDLYQLFYKK